MPVRNSWRARATPLVSKNEPEKSGGFSAARRSARWNVFSGGALPTSASGSHGAAVVPSATTATAPARRVDALASAFREMPGTATRRSCDPHA